MTGYVVRQADVKQSANQGCTEHFRTALVQPVVPVDALCGGWPHLATGAANPADTPSPYGPVTV